MDTERPEPAQQGTGDPRVDEAIAGLSGLRDAPLDEHPSVLEAVHDRLREILGELGSVPSGGTPADTARGPRRPGERWQQGPLPPGGTPPAYPRSAPGEEANVAGARQEQ